MHADALALAAGFGGAAGLEGELARLDLEGADTRLSALEATLATEEARALVRDLRRDLAGGRRALTTVATEFSAGGWRRVQMADPRSKSRNTHATVAADAAGLTLRIGGATQVVPWSAFGARPDRLHQLFHERLERDYTAEERADVAGLLRVTAVVRAVGDASRALAGDTEARPDEGFEDALTWARLAGDPIAVERERDAARMLAQALAAGAGDSMGEGACAPWPRTDSGNRPCMYVARLLWVKMKLRSTQAAFRCRRRYAPI